MKVIYPHSARRIPDKAIEIIDAIYDTRKKKEPALRKGDLWLEAATNLKEKK